MNPEISPDVQPYRQPDHAVEPAFVNRWSPRAFSPEPIDEETLMSLFEAARWAASSYNEQPWRFLLARSESDRAKFLEFLIPMNQEWAKHAPVLVLTASKKTFSMNGQPNSVNQFDAGTASGYLTLQASKLGLISHGMAGFDRDRARTVLNVPDDFDLLAVFAIGKHGDKSILPPAMQEREIPSGRRPVSESVMEGGFRPSEEVQAEKDTDTPDLKAN